MTTNTVYQKMIDDMPEGLGREIMTVLEKHVGSDKRISRPQLVQAVFGYLPKGNFKDSREDRQVRRQIAELIEAGYPVLSDSGKGGYWLGTKDEREKFIRELESRRKNLAAKITALRAGKRMKWQEPKVVVPYTQPTLF